MQNLHPSEAALLTALAAAKHSWLTAAVEAIREPRSIQWTEVEEAWSSLAERIADRPDREAFQAVVNELLSGLCHSLLVVLDGGAELANSTSLTVQDEQGHVLKRFLHEFWPGFSDGKAEA